jgi:hypothetical protein
MDAASQKPQTDQQGYNKPTNHDKKRIDWKRVRFIAAVVTIIEIVSYVLWQEADDFTGLTAILIHWFSKCGGLLGAAVISHKVAEIAKRQKRVWFVYAVLCAIMLAIPLKKLYKQTSEQPAEQVAPVTGWQPPELPKGCDRIVITMGDRVYISENPFVLEHYYKDGQPFGLAQGNNGPLRIRVSNNRIYVDADIAVNSPPVYTNVAIRGSSVTGILPSWHMNDCTDAIEIVDDTYRPIYQIWYETPDRVHIMGSFWSGSNVVSWGSHGFSYKATDANAAWLDLKPIFKYPTMADRPCEKRE